MNTSQTRARCRRASLVTTRMADSRLRQAIARALIVAVTLPPFTPSGVAVTVAASPLARAVTTPAGQNTCALYPIALHASSLNGVAAGTTIRDIFNGAGAGNFGWLTWTGSPSVPTLVKSLTPSGDSKTYVNPANASDHDVSTGDWVQSKPGVSNSSNVRAALDALEAIDITVPVWDQAQGGGSNASYRVSAFAKVRLLSYQLPSQNRISVRFLGFSSCQAAVNKAPVVDAGADQTITLPAGALLSGTVTDDGLPAGAPLTTTWSKASGPGTVTFASPSSAATTAFFSAAGLYVLRLTASDSQLTGSDTKSITVQEANRPPTVNAGPDQRVSLPDNPPLTGSPLKAVVTGVNHPAGVAYHQQTNSIAVSLNSPSGLPHNLDLIAADGTRSPFSSASGFTGELSIATARDEGGGLSRGGFRAGELFTGTGVPGAIARVSSDGSTIASPWVVLPGEDGTIAGGIAIDRTGVFGGDLIAATTTGGIWRVNAAGVATALTRLTTPLEGVQTIPADARYGPWAGKILASAGAQAKLYAIDRTGMSAAFDLGIRASSVGVIPANENFFAIDPMSGTLWGAPASVFAGVAGDVLVTEDSPGAVWAVRWDGATFQKTLIASLPELRQVAFGPAGIGAIPPLNVTVPLNGVASDDDLPQGSALTVAWTKQSGPDALFFADATRAATTATVSAPGTYVVRLAATDGAFTVFDEATIVVDSGNAAPVVNAGPDQTITEADTATLAGTVVDDGLPPDRTLTIEWHQVSGPGTATFSSPTQARTTATFSAPGSYVLRLSASDTQFTTTDDAIVTVNRTPNQPPRITSTPITDFTLGPRAATAAPIDVATWTVQDYNSSSPIARPSMLLSDFTVASTRIEGNVSVDTSAGNGFVGFVFGYQDSGHFYLFDWKKADETNAFGLAERGMSVKSFTADSTPTAADFWPTGGNGTRVRTLYHNTVPWMDSTNYTFALEFRPGRISITIHQGNAVVDVISLEDATFVDGRIGFYTLAQEQAHFTGFGRLSLLQGTYAYDVDAMDPNNDTLTYSLDLAPPGMAIAPASGLIRWPVTVNETGEHQVTVRAQDPGGLFDTQSYTLTVHDPNQPPMVDAGADLTIGLAGTAMLNGSVSDDGLPGGTISIEWTQVSGPGAASFADATRASTTASFDQTGTYVLRLSATDTQLSSSDEVTVIVERQNHAPDVDAGADETITLPDNATLQGTASDDGLPSGSALAVSWSIVSGPGVVTFGDASAAHTTATFSTAGPYVLRLSATDSQLSDSDDVTVTVKAANEGPSVSAGADQTVTFPVTAALNGSATDDGLPDGSTLSVSWTRVGGPGTVTFANTAAAATTASFSALGTYLLRLTGSDSQLTSSDDVIVTVNAANEAPAVNAGGDQSITLPNTANLSGSVSDDGLPARSVVATTWSLVSGPGAVTFDNPHATATSAHFVTPGTYVLRLAATDSDLTGSDEVKITADAFVVNQPPVVAAGADQTVTLPAAADLAGTVTDDGLPAGSTLVTTWSQVSGPGTTTFSDVHARITSASFSAAGTYVLRLSGSDTALTGSDDVRIQIRAPTVDLTVAAIDASGVTTDSQTLVISGAVQVSVQNTGADAASNSFEVTVFEDRNGDRMYQLGDALLGTQVFTGSIASGGVSPLAVPVSGVVSFAGGVIDAFVDSAHQVAETDETNNVGRTGLGTIYHPPPGDFALKVKWQFNSPLNNSGVSHAPLVAPVVDTNGDGVVTANDIPAVIFLLGGNFQGADGHLMAVRGDTGAVIFDTPTTYGEFGADTNPAVGDLDGDGTPEVVIAECCRGVIHAINNDGTRKWQSPVVTYRSSPTIADLDGDGHAEILYGCTIFNFDGTVRRRDCPLNIPTYVGGNTQTAVASQVADLDLDGIPEIVRGPSAYDKDGNLLWYWQTVGSSPFTLRGTLDRGATIVNPPIVNFFLNDAFTAVANLDADPNPEIIVAATRTIGVNGLCGDSLWVFEHDGRIKNGFPVCLYQDVINGDTFDLGSPTIVNVDDDPEPEIVIPATKAISAVVNGIEVSRYMLAVYEANGSLKWRRDLIAGRSTYGPPPASAFDFDGDGKAELVYRDEQILYILNGSDGTIRYQFGVGGSSLSTAYPVIADADNDGIADIVVPAGSLIDGSPLRRGVVVLSDTKGNWRNARPVWNQWLYHVTNINENASVPRVQANNWQFLNTSRTQASADSQNPLGAPDLALSRLGINSLSCQTNGTIDVSVRVGNGGALQAGPGQRVAFYRGTPAARGTLLGQTHTTKRIAPGEFEDVTLKNVGTPFPSQLFAVVGEPATQTPIQSSNLAALPHTWAQASGYCTGCTTIANVFTYRGIDGQPSTVWIEDPYRNGLIVTIGPSFYEAHFPFGVSATSLRIQNNPNAGSYITGFLTGTITASNGFSMAVALDANGQGTFSFPEQQNVTWIRLTATTTLPGGPSLSEFIVGGTYVEPEFGINEGPNHLDNNVALSAAGLAPCDPSVEQPPVITSAPPIGATVETPYVYPVGAGDFNNDQLAYSLVVFPSGMTIDAAGVVAWTPSGADLGSHSVTIEVSDGRGGTTDQSFILQVRPPNHAPDVNAGADQTITLNKPAILNATAHDDGLPAGSPVTASWTVIGGPGAVVFGSASAIATTATFSATGSFLLRLTASDSQFTVSDEVTITVNPIPPNQAPMVDAGPDQVVTLPNRLTLFSKIADDDLPVGATVTSSWSKVAGPGTVTFTPGLANVVTAAFSDPGLYVLRLSANDTQLTGSDDVSVNVIGVPVNHAPTTDAGADQSINLQNGASPASTNLVGVESDDGLPVDGPVTMLWTQISGPAAVSFGTASQATTTAVFTARGTYVLRLSASDSELSASDDITVEVFDAITGPAPEVSIASPADAAEIRSRTTFVGSISGGNWRLEYSLNSDDGSSNQTWTTLASGTGPVTNAVLGTFDPTLLLNGVYGIRLVSRDNAGQTSVLERSAVVIGDQKIGHLTLSFSDMRVAVGGISIEILRTYDSRDKRNGDFGVAWTLGIRNVRVEKSGKLGTNWLQTRSTGFFPSYCLEQARPQTVTITFPDGRVFRFQPVTTPRCQTLTPIELTTIGFTQVPGSPGTAGATLESLSGVDVFVSGSTPGASELLDLETFTPFDPAVLRLTTAEGEIYVIDQHAGIRSMADANGNSLLISRDGVIHSSGRSITFTRDAHDRIIRVTDPLSHAVEYEYNAAGDLIHVTDQERAVTAFEYFSLTPHLLERIVNPDGHVVNDFRYDSSGRVVASCNEANECAQFEHDLNGRTETLIDRTGRRVTYTYDLHGNVLAKTDGLNHTTTFEYDADDNLLRQTDAAGNVTTYTYDERHNRLSITEPHRADQASGDFTTTYTYDARNALTSITKPAGAQLRMAYDDHGNLIRVTDEHDNVVSSYGYTAAGGLTGTTTAFGTTTSAYDPGGNEVQSVDVYGNTTTATYDAAGQLATTTARGFTSTHTYDGVGRERSVDYGGGVSVAFQYGVGPNWTDATGPTIGALRRTYTPEGQLSSWTRDGGTEKYDYDAAGRPVQTTDPLGHVTRYRYDAAGQLAAVTEGNDPETTFAHDPAGRLIRQTDPLGNAVDYSYAPDGTLASMTNARGQTWAFRNTPTSATVRDPLGREGTVVRSADGLPIQVLHPDGSSTSTTYLFPGPAQEAAEYPTSVTDEDGHTRRFDYDTFGRLASATDRSGARYTYRYDEDNLSSIVGPTAETLSLGHDEEGRLTTITYPDGARRALTYLRGNLPESITLPSAATVTYEYDDAGRITGRTSSLGEQARFSFNAKGQVSAVQDAGGTTLQLHDTRGRLSGADYPDGARIRYDRDPLGRLLRVRSQASAASAELVTEYTYDTVGNVISVTDPLGGTTSMVYDQVNRLERRTLPNGVSTSYEYDRRDRISSVVHRNAAGDVLASARYARQGVGEPTRIDWEDGSFVLLTYDAALRLTEEAYYEASGARVEERSYTYDAVGNRRTVHDSSGDRTYTYAPGGKLVHVDGAAGAEDYGYDADGRVSSIARNGATLALGFDTGDHLTSVENPATGSRVSYRYDGLGRRIRATDVVGERRFVVAPAMGGGLESPQLLLDASGSIAAGYVYVGDRPLMRFGPDGPVYYLTDAMGSVMSLADGTGGRVARYQYDGFGNMRTALGSATGAPARLGGDFRFQGAWLETASGLYHLRAREYDPRVGRFLSRDPADPELTEPERLNPYVFANSNPHVFSDPSGEFTLVEVQLSLSIQDILRGAEQMAVRHLKDKAVDKINEQVGKILIGFVNSMVPFGDVGEAWNLGLSTVRGANPTNPGAGGNFFERVMHVNVCGFVGGDFASHLFLEVPVGTDGEAHGSGINCGNLLGSLGSIARSNIYPNPDFVFSDEPPNKLAEDGDHSWLIGDFKLNVRNIRRNNQWNAIVNHAAKYGSRVALWVTLKGTEIQAQNRSAWTVRSGVYSVILIILD